MKERPIDPDFLISELRGAAHYLVGMSLDPRLPFDVAAGCRSKGEDLHRVVKRIQETGGSEDE